jgi:hypothetical protein
MDSVHPSSLHSVNAGLCSKLCRNFSESAVSWLVVGLITARCKPRIHLSMASPCPVWRTFGFSWFQIYMELEWRSHAYARLQQVHTNLRIGDLAFKMPYLCDCIYKLCRAQAQVIVNHGNTIDSGLVYWQNCTLCYSLLMYVTVFML